MKIKLSLLLLTVIASVYLHAQNHTGTTGDMRTFAFETQVTVTQNPFGLKANTVGSRFLYPEWVRGSATNTAGTVFTGGFYNFDKITQNLYMKMSDSTKGFLVDKNQLTLIRLQDGNTSYYLEKIPSLKNDNFYNALAKGKKYSLYSFTKTKFIPNDFHTNGIVESGNNFDQYKDEIFYYIVMPDGSAKQIVLKYKSIKSFFASEAAEIDQFFKQNASSAIDEKFLVSLVNQLNQ